MDLNDVQQRDLAFEVLELINSHQSVGAVVREIALAIRSALCVDAVGVRLREGDDFPYFAVDGFPAEFVERESSISCRDADGSVRHDRASAPSLDCICGRVIVGRTDPRWPWFTAAGSFWTNSTTDLPPAMFEHDGGGPIRGQCNKAGYETVVLVPLQAIDETIGLLQLNDHRRDRCSEELVCFLEGLASSIGVGLTRRNAADQLTESEQRFRNIVRATPLGMHLYELGGNGQLFFTGANPAADRILGVENEQFIGKTILEAFPALAETEIPARYQAAAIHGEEWHAEQIEYEGERIKGAFEVHAFQTEPNRMAAVFADVTDRKRSDAEVRMHRELALALAGTSSLEEALGLCLEAGFANTGFDCGGIYLVNEQTGDVELVRSQGLGAEFVAAVAKIEADTPSAQLVMAGAPVYRDYRELLRPADKIREREGLEYLGVIPIRHEGQVVACLNLGTHTTVEITDHDRRIVESTAAQMGGVVARLKTIEALRENESRYRTTIEATTDMLHVVDRELVIELCNEAYRKALVGAGMPGEPVGRELFEACPFLSATVRAEYERVLETGVPLHTEERTEVAGRAVWTETHKTPVRNADGTIVGVLTVMRDISGKKAAEQRQRRYTESLALLAESAIGFVTLHRDADIYEYICEQATRLLGKRPVVVAEYVARTKRLELRSLRQLSRSSTEIRRIAEIDLDHLEVRIGEKTARALIGKGLTRLKGGIHELLGGQISTSSARAIDQLLGIEQVHAIGFAHGEELLGALGIMTCRYDPPLDPTLVEAFVGQASVALERWRAEREKADLEDQLFHAQKLEAIGALASGVAHDFNNLLTGVLGHAHMLKSRHEPGSSVFKSAESIETSALRASELTKQLLGFARKGKRTVKTFDLRQLVVDVCYFLEHTFDKRIELKNCLADHRLLVDGDPSQLQAVILNLAINGRDAMPTGGQLVLGGETVVIEPGAVGGRPDCQPGQYHVISVRDTGEGIAADVRERIFEPFFSTKPAGEGTGMGLAMAYGIVREHGGWIDVESEKGVGSEFRVFLPIHPESERQPSTQSAGQAVRGTGRILVVDDEPAVRRMIARLLRSLGYEVITMPGGQEAVDYFAAHRDEVDLVTLDQSMPGMNGSTCFRALKKLDPEVRVLLVTGNSAATILPQYEEEGLAGIVEKPLMLNAFSVRIAEALRR